MRLAPGGEIVLAGFYSDRPSFAFPPAFMREARFRIAAQWQPADLVAARDLAASGALSTWPGSSPTAPRPRLRRTRTAPHSRIPTVSRWSWIGRHQHERDHAQRHDGRASFRSGYRARCGSDWAGQERDADHRHLRQGRHRQELHARQPQLHDGPAGQARPADRLRPQERHHVAAVRGPLLPDHYRDLIQEEGRWREGRDRRRLLHPRRRVCHGAWWPRGRPRLRRARHHPRLRTAREARLPRLGLRLRAARLPRRRRLRRVRPADRAGHVPEGDRRRVERPAVALCRQQRLLGGRVFPQAWRQCRRRRHRHQQG